MTDHFDENFALVIEEERETIPPKKKLSTSILSRARTS